MQARFLTTVFCSALLTACNGGYFGSDDNDSSGGGGSGNGSTASGLWTGTTSDRYTYTMLVTPDNQVWGMSYDVSSSSAFRLFRGTGTTSGRNFTGSGKSFGGSTSGSVASGNITGAVTSSASFDGTLPQNITFVTTFAPQYNTGASLADLAGTWNGRDNTGSAVEFSVDGNGSYTARATVAGKTGTCTITGRFVAAATGRGYTTTTASFGGASNCADSLQGKNLSQGIGLRLAATDSATQPLLLVQAVDANQSVAWFAYARRQAPAATQTPAPDAQQPVATGS